MNTTTYKVKFNNSIVVNKPSIFSRYLGVLYKDNKIEVINTSGFWAYFKYNKKNAYILIFLLEEVLEPPISTGSVTINYLEDITNTIISDSIVFDNLPFSSYTYSAKKINNYSLVGESTQSISLSSANPNQIIIFKYKKILGNIVIKFVDNLSQTEISDKVVLNNLELNTYTYSAKDIVGYSLLGDSSKTVTLTEDTPNIVITFEYTVLPPILDESKQNEVPYISTYYIKPIVSTNEDVILDFYITDFYHKEYINEDTSETFTVTININGLPSLTKTNMPAGDNSINLGKFNNLGEQKFSILCTDKHGRNSHELFNFFLVRNEVVIKEYIMTEADLISYNIKNIDNYEVKRLVKLDLPVINTDTINVALAPIAANILPEPNKYICIIPIAYDDGFKDNWWKSNICKYGVNYDKGAVLQEATNTRNGLQKLLDDKSSQGYNRLKLLPGVYRIDHLGTLFIPTSFTLDMNTATLKLNEFTGNKSLMMELNNTFDSHVINGTIEGDYFNHDYANSPNNSEWVNGISIGGESKYSSFENLVIKDITGYGAGNGIANSRDGKSGYTYLYPRGIGNAFKLGDINRSTGDDVVSTNRTTCDFRDISGYSDIGYLSISRYLGYQGNPCGSWNLICHFYDINKKFIRSTDACQYRRVAVPPTAKFVRVTILSLSYPTDLSIQLFRIPTHCAFKNIKLDNCRCVGMAQAAMKDMLVENCEFSKCGQTSANCAYDAEDGWDMMQDVTFKKLDFHNNPLNDFLTCAGHNFVVEDMIAGKVHFWERTNSYIVRNCKNMDTAYVGNNTRIRTGYRRFFNNIITGTINSASQTDWIMVIKDCKIYKRADGNSYSTYLRCNIGPNIISSVTDYSYGLSSAIYRNCIIKNLNSQHHYAGQFYYCKIENIRGLLQGIPTNLLSLFKNCELTNIEVSAFDKEGFLIQIENCTLTNLTINKSYWDKQLNLTILNSVINNEKQLLRLPHYAMKKPINLINNKFTSIGTLGMINFYDDRTGGQAGELIPQDIIKIEGNSITLPNSPSIITGLTKTTVNNINIVSINNNYSPVTLVLCSPEAMQCPNITIK